MHSLLLRRDDLIAARPDLVATIGRLCRIPEEFPTNVCWLWPGTSRPYITLRPGFERSAGRVVCALQCGEVAAGHEASHDCGEKRCVNPSHLCPLPVSQHRRWDGLIRRDQAAAGEGFGRVPLLFRRLWDGWRQLGEDTWRAYCEALGQQERELQRIRELGEG